MRYCHKIVIGQDWYVYEIYEQSPPRVFQKMDEPDSLVLKLSFRIFHSVVPCFFSLIIFRRGW